MAYKTFMVHTYQIKLGEGLTGGGGGDKTRGYLYVRGDEGYLVVYFAAPGSSIKAPWTAPDATRGTINVPVEEMHNYVDLVRNEAPMYLYLNSDRPEWNSISTSGEPVGEEET